MFEDFSFSSPTSQPPRLGIDTEDRLMIDCDSALISPLSSRCSSPSRRFRTLSRSKSSYFRSQQPPPTSVPFSYEQKRLSISTLTQKLHEHTLQTPNESVADRGRLNYDGFRLSGRYPGCILTPPDMDHDDTGRSDSSLSLCSIPSPTSIPPEFSRGSLEGPMDFPQLDHLNVRTRRQNLSQLQCNKDDMEAIRCAVLSEDSMDPELSQDDCHPSSLPPRSSPRRRVLALHRSRFGPPDISADPRGRRRSNSITMQSHRIEKSHIPFPGRDASKRCEQGLRRKSMVSAALASVVEHA
ncbi:hypothetical protein N7495_003567 [Penicillium taxi]|uniref:uncharacterized protein n=1 Tax=Penicillium taxi TaxID=168475 RepID=UPI0025458A79|nr:uncharacterized protein N7495_003567 [Penicillium taxi]KAJ5898823.1 hypothetical protein N7495_003567 [Penicillium taxi]